MQKSVIKDNSVEVSKSSEFIVLSNEESSKQYYDFGDTLQASFWMLDSIAVDSTESDGIKLIVTTARQTNGEVKTSVRAIAKPAQIVNESFTKHTDQRQIATIDSVKKDLVTETKTKRVEVNNAMIIVAVVCAFIAIIGLLFYIYGQIKKWW